MADAYRPLTLARLCRGLCRYLDLGRDAHQTPGCRFWFQVANQFDDGLSAQLITAPGFIVGAIGGGPPENVVDEIASVALAC